MWALSFHSAYDTCFKLLFKIKVLSANFHMAWMFLKTTSTLNEILITNELYVFLLLLLKK